MSGSGRNKSSTMLGCILSVTVPRQRKSPVGYSLRWCFHPSSVPAFFNALDDSFFAHVMQCFDDHGSADSRATLLDIRNPKIRHERLDYGAYPFPFPPSLLGVFYIAYPFFKAIIDPQNDCQEILNPRQQVLVSVMPSLRGLVQRVVILLFGFFDDLFEAKELGL